MIIIYNKEKQKVQELVDKILQEHPEYGEVTVIGDLSELPENIKISEVVDTTTGMYIQDPNTMSTTDLVREFEKACQYHRPEIEIPEIPDTSIYEPEHPYKQTEFQKLSSFNRKEKNQARRKLEHQALKYQNKHWRK